MSDEPFKKIVLPIIKDVEMKPLDLSALDVVPQNVLDLIRNTFPKMIADLMTGLEDNALEATMRRIWENSKSEKDLIAEGYEPVSHHRLMWIKKEPKPKVLKESCTCYRCNISMVRGKAIDPKYEDTCCHGWHGGPKIQSADEIEMIDVWKCPQCGHSESLYE